MKYNEIKELADILMWRNPKLDPDEAWELAVEEWEDIPIYNASGEEY